MHKLHGAAIGGIALRNAVPVAGMLLFGWRAPQLVLLYYVDTMVGIASLFTFLFMFAKDTPLDTAKPRELPGVVVAVVLLTGVFGLVFGMPLIFVSAFDEIVFDEQLGRGLLVQLLVGCVTFLTMSHELRRSRDAELLIKARWTFVTMRWVAVFAICTFLAWPPLVVLTYVVASAWLEIRPLPPEGPI